MARKQDRSTIDTHRWKNGTRFAVAERARFRCECCHKYLGMKGQADHITPRSQCEAAGLDPFDLKNLQWLCASCHSKKTNRERMAGREPKPRNRFNRVQVAGRGAFHAAIQSSPNPQTERMTMLKSQEITLAQSKRREAMAAIQKTETISDEGRAELRSLADAYEGGEVELRAALLVEGVERDAIKEPDRADISFETECRAFNLSGLVAALTDGKPLAGREAEVSAELETRHGEASKGVRFPFEALLETRADAATDASTGASGNLASRPTMNALERFFEGSAAERFGVKTMQVTGAPLFPEITGGAGLSWVSEGAGADADALTTTAANPAIHTATGRYLLTRQAIRQNSALEPILRRDLSEVLREGIDLAIFQGTGADEQPGGFETVLTGGRTAALDDVASFSEFLLRATEIQETAKLSDPAGVRIAGAPIVHQTLADALISGTAVSELDRLKAAGFAAMWSSQVSARGARDGTDKGASTVYFGAGANNAFVPTWGSPELLVDPYSESKTGKVALTMFAFVDVLIQRTATHYFKLTGVQDRA